ncbi:hypothetical protein B0J18DRAFT_430982 [Chaetomium sp. MPI-SDFR-AT-0129]|nr:hypothetical protein B0J18DRAFT_430982 [Chaetomium sp. MPI-SDFR-AT-0129]
MGLLERRVGARLLLLYPFYFLSGFSRGLHLGYGLRRKLVAGEWTRSHFLLGVPRCLLLLEASFIARTQPFIFYVWGSVGQSIWDTRGSVAALQCVACCWSLTTLTSQVGWGSVRFGSVCSGAIRWLVSWLIGLGCGVFLQATLLLGANSWVAGLGDEVRRVA